MRIFWCNYHTRKAQIQKTYELVGSQEEGKAICELFAAVMYSPYPRRADVPLEIWAANKWEAFLTDIRTIVTGKTTITNLCRYHNNQWGKHKGACTLSPKRPCIHAHFPKIESASLHQIDYRQRAQLRKVAFVCAGRWMRAFRTIPGLRGQTTSALAEVWHSMYKGSALLGAIMARFATVRSIEHLLQVIERIRCDDVVRREGVSLLCAWYR